MNRTKRLVSKFAIALSSALLGCAAYGQPSVSVAVTVPLPSVEIRAESDFYEPLTPHGEWVVVGSYGRCWRPAHVEVGWRPYCNGHWERTEAGWYWVSEEPWAWATYHYGRWDFTDQYGWYWVPQTQWAPAWVSWHSGGGYVGWAPLQPSVTISVSGYVGFNQARISPRAFVFVEQRRFLEPIRPTTVVVNNTTIINQTTVINNTKVVNNAVINEGPAPTVIEKASGRKVQAVAVQELRHKQEAAVASKQPSAASGKKAERSAPTDVEASGKKAVAAPARVQTEKPTAVTTDPVAPVTKSRETQREKHKPEATPDSTAPASKKEAPTEKYKPAPAVPDAKREPKPEGNSPALNKERNKPKSDKHVEQEQKPANPSEKKAKRPANEEPAASEGNGANPAADKEHEKKPKE